MLDPDSGVLADVASTSQGQIGTRFQVFMDDSPGASSSYSLRPFLFISLLFHIPRSMFPRFSLFFVSFLAAQHLLTYLRSSPSMNNNTQRDKLNGPLFPGARCETLEIFLNAARTLGQQSCDSSPSVFLKKKCTFPIFLVSGTLKNCELTKFENRGFPKVEQAREALIQLLTSRPKNHFEAST